MKKVRLFAVMLTLVAGAWFAERTNAAMEHMDHGSASGKNASWKSVKMSGEFVDLGCYVAHDAYGKKHLSCAIECSKAGAPLAFVERGTKRLFVIITTGHGQNPYTEAIKYLAESVEVEGATADKDGMTALMITDIKKVKSGKKIVDKAKDEKKQVAQEKYVCPMDGYSADKPGNCPKCGMKLVLRK